MRFITVEGEMLSVKFNEDLEFWLHRRIGGFDIKQEIMKNGARSENRTHDLALTKGVLYH